MALRRGISTGRKRETPKGAACPAPRRTAGPRRSVVQVKFPGRGMPLAYYNDCFDLHKGDQVYVDGKLEGQLGQVTEVSYNFKIKISDYKRVIAVVDTRVKGRFLMAGPHFVTFDPSALPAAKAALWFRAPAKEGEEYVSGDDGSSFPLTDLKGMNVSGAVAERGHEYFLENRVRYLCLDGTHGYAIAEGSEAYELEFSCRNGQVSGLSCSCFCSYACKHEFAVMLQLRKTLDLIEKRYRDEYRRSGYFAAIDKDSLFSFAIAGRESGSLML